MKCSQEFTTLQFLQQAIKIQIGIDTYQIQLQERRIQLMTRYQTSIAMLIFHLSEQRIRPKISKLTLAHIIKVKVFPNTYSKDSELYLVESPKIPKRQKLTNIDDKIKELLPINDYEEFVYRTQVKKGILKSRKKISKIMNNDIKEIGAYNSLNAKSVQRIDYKQEELTKDEKHKPSHYEKVKNSLLGTGTGGTTPTRYKSLSNNISQTNYKQSTNLK